VKYRDFIKIIEAYGFKQIRQGATSHRQYEGIIKGKRQMVTIAGEGGDDILPKTLASMKRQSGLPKKTFR
jgi:predicted RNA binding protein YcfA (HicA-like mRNA interferase family)